jgi:PAS domain S-box-containing protein
MITKDKYSPDLFREILQKIPVGVIAVTAAGQVESWNTAAARILGWTPEEVAGKPLPVELPANAEEEVAVQAVSKHGDTVNLKVRSIPWNDPSGSAGSVIILVHDETALHRAERALEELKTKNRESALRERENARLRELLEAAPDAIIEVDAEGHIVLMNSVTEQLFGYAREELLGQPVELLVPDAMRGGHHDNRDGFRKTPGRRPMGTGLKLEGQRKDGSRVPVEISLSPSNGEEGFRVTAIIRDVTGRRNQEEELRTAQQRYTQSLAAQNRVLELQNEEAVRASHLKDEFLSGMSHELRTPLHTIIGFTELLDEQLAGPLNEKQQRFVRHISRDSQHLLALINDVLDLSKIESGWLELHYEDFLLDEAIEETVSSVRPRAEAKALDLRMDVKRPLRISADRLRLRQILYNLLSNAVKFTPQGGRILVEAAADDGSIEVSVTDTGVGIAISEQGAVFDKFYQVGQRHLGGSEGTGLGLAITKHLVTAHGGTIGLVSAPGQGSRFTFRIPKAKKADNAGA